MSVLSTEEFLRQGHQVDLDMMNLDSAIQGLHQESAVPFADFSSWQALYAEWKHDYDTNIASVPLFPLQSDDLLQKWLKRITQWRTKSQRWALTGSMRARAIVSAIPDSPAIAAYQERPPPASMPPWAWILLGSGALTAMGYALASAAKLGKVARG